MIPDELNPSSKIQLPLGNVKYLIGEVETLRHRLAVAQARTDVMDNFFNLIDAVRPPLQTYGNSEDKLHQAKREFRYAMTQAAKDQPTAERPAGRGPFSNIEEMQTPEETVD